MEEATMYSPRPRAVVTALAALLLGGSTAHPSAAALSPVRALGFPAPEVQGIAYGGGSLWVAGSMGPGMTLVFELDPATGSVRTSFFASATVGSMSHDGSSLFVTNDAGAQACGGGNPNTVSVLDPSNGSTVRTMPSPVTGMASGLAFVGSRFFASGQVDPDACTPGDEVIGVAEGDPASGSRLASLGAAALGAGPRLLSSDGYNLLYAAWGADSGDPFSFHWNVHTLSTSGSESAVVSLDDIVAPDPSAAEQSFHVTGMAWGSNELYVANSTSGMIQVYSF